jgi:hypothetical protein
MQHRSGGLVDLLPFSESIAPRGGSSYRKASSSTWPASATSFQTPWPRPGRRRGYARASVVVAQVMMRRAHRGAKPVRRLPKTSRGKDAHPPRPPLARELLRLVDAVPAAHGARSGKRQRWRERGRSARRRRGPLPAARCPPSPAALLREAGLVFEPGRLPGSRDQRSRSARAPRAGSRQRSGYHCGCLRPSGIDVRWMLTTV